MSGLSVGSRVMTGERTALVVHGVRTAQRRPARVFPKEEPK